jgi:hypothetical protein
MNLVSINAAILLGCRAMPPTGSMISVSCHQTDFSWVEVLLSEEAVTDVFSVYVQLGHDQVLINMACDSVFYEVVELPDDAPPFDEWEDL